MRSLILLLLFFSSTLSFAQSSDWQQKVDASVLAKAKMNEKTEFLVVLTEQARFAKSELPKRKEEKAAYVFEQLQTTAERTQAPFYPILENHNALYQPLFLVNLIWVEGDLALITTLAQRKDVAYLAANPTVRFEEPMKGNSEIDWRGGTVEWGIATIKANSVWQLGYRGQGVVVGGQDTGYDWTHPALQQKYRGWNAGNPDHNYNWHDAIHQINPLNDTINDPSLNPCGLDVLVPCDDNRHGTHTMGTMVGEEGENQVGVAPEAQWIGCRNMERGYGTPFTYLECFQWFLAPTDLNDENPDPAKAPHVIANSWSCPEMEGCTPANFEVMQLAVQNLTTSGVVVVVSAGNRGSSCNTVNTPAAIFEESFSVGATRQNDTIASFSSRGVVTVDGSMRLKPNVSAPGVNVRSTIPDGGYASFSGTSMAGPHVAGAVALLISANPELAGQVEQIESILEQTAVPKTTAQDCHNISGATIPNAVYGYGRIDVLKAVELALTISSTKTSLPAEQAVRVFPNPASEQVTFQTKRDLGDVTITLFDLQGRRVRQINWQADAQNTVHLPVSFLPKGVYIYSLQGAKIATQGKLVRQ